ncbi:monocarboxylate transporter 13-like [Haliotis rufescens]|uniref:monocarboxylate transporter 13-like n=1 Tax=Haliotis rufescens TaxID=6454 RepID=UPI001EB06778|nr:monocarboxylate transporter 13-like [Haliotis rufescens]
MAFKYRPDQIDCGWAWVIVAASFFAHFICFGISWTTGIYHVIFLEEFKASQAVTAWACSLMPASMFAAGPVASLLLNKLGCRVTMVIGGLTSSSGLILSYFAPNIIVLYVTFGVIAGFGFGVAHLAAISSVTYYFERRRNMATGMAVMGVGVGTIAFPPFIRILVEDFTWKGSMLILAGLCLNLCVCAGLIRPIKRPELRSVSRNVMDTSIFRKPCYWMACLNSFMVCVGLSITYIHIAAYAENCGLGKEKSTLLISGIGFANVFGRLAMGLLAQHPKMNLILLYLVSFIIAGVAVTLTPIARTWDGLIAIAAVFGCFTAGIGTLFAPILARILGLRRFATGYGCLALINGFGQMIGGPLAGLLHDMTGNYLASFLTGGISLVLSSVFMIVPLRYKDVALNTGVSIRVKCGPSSAASPLTAPVVTDIDDDDNIGKESEENTSTV